VRAAKVLGCGLLAAVVACGKSEASSGASVPSLPAAPITAASAAPQGSAPVGFDDRLLSAVSGKVIAGQVVQADGHPVNEAVVHVKDGLTPAKYVMPKDPIVVDQRQKTFVPRVVPVLVGTTLMFKNSDPVLHNVYSRSGVKTFDLGAYSNQEAKSTLFDKAGRVDVFCAIHTNMHAVVLVLDNPYFAKTDERGYFEIREVPDGSYTVAFWTDTKGETEMHADVTADRPAVLRARLP